MEHELHRAVVELGAQPLRGVASDPAEFIRAFDSGGQILRTRTGRQHAAAATYDLSRFNPYRVESLLDRLLRQLQACLTLRSEYLTFQAKAEDRRLEYELFGTLQELDGRLRTLGNDPRSVGRLSVQEELNSRPSEDPAETVTRGSTDSLDRAKSLQVELNSLEEERARAVSRHEQALASRDASPEDGRNYSKRASRVLERLARLLTESHFIALVVADGCRIVYGLQSEDPPQPGGTDALDHLVRWAQNVLRLLEITLRSDSEHHVLIDLKRAKNGEDYVTPTWHSDAGVNSRRADAATLNQRVLSFQLEKSWFPGMNRRRLRAVSCFVEPADKATWQISIEPPEMAVGSQGEKVAMLPLFFGAVTERSGHHLAANSESPYFNLDPCSGPWEVRIVGASSRGEEFSKIRTIELILTVASTL